MNELNQPNQPNQTKITKSLTGGQTLLSILGITVGSIVLIAGIAVASGALDKDSNTTLSSITSTEKSPTIDGRRMGWGERLRNFNKELQSMDFENIPGLEDMTDEEIDTYIDQKTDELTRKWKMTDEDIDNELPIDPPKWFLNPYITSKAKTPVTSTQQVKSTKWNWKDTVQKYKAQGIDIYKTTTVNCERQLNGGSYTVLTDAWVCESKGGTILNIINED